MLQIKKTKDQPFKLNSRNRSLHWQIKGYHSSCVLDVLAKKNSNQTPLNLYYFRLMVMKCQNTYLDIEHACFCFMEISKYNI